jgi:RNA polymerase sigma factor for flagellar operon FliA
MPAVPTTTELSPTAATGSAPGEDELVRSHLPLVQYVVSEVAGRIPRHVHRDDLVSAGMVGLAQAARTFDPGRQVSFARFATTRIRGAVLDELRSRDWASRSVRAKAREMTEATDRLTATLGRSPTCAELADELGMDPGSLDSVRRDVQRSVVLNLDGMGLDGSFEDLAPATGSTPDSVVVDRERQAYLVAAVANLPARLRRVVMGYFFEELPMRVLAEELGVTDSRISQMRSEALDLLRCALETHLDREEAPRAEAERSGGRATGATRRTAAYLASVGSHYDYRRRLDPRSGLLGTLGAGVA